MNEQEKQDAYEKISLKAGESVSDLFLQNLSIMDRSMDDQGKDNITVSVSFKLSRLENGAGLVSKLSFGTRHTDARADRINFGQTEMDFSPDETDTENPKALPPGQRKLGPGSEVQEPDGPAPEGATPAVIDVEPEPEIDTDDDAAA